MDGEPFYKRLIDDLARSNVDLSYKFKSADQVAKQNDTPNSVMAGSPASSQPGVSYTDNTEIPGRPTFPFEVRVMVDGNGALSKIRCYKGKIYDPRTGENSASFKGLLTQGLTSRKRVTITGNRGNVSGDQRDFTPSNWDPGPEQHKYTDFNDPVQTTWLPDYEGLAYGSLRNAGKDSDPVQTTATYATGSFPIGKDSFTAADDGAYFEWDYTDGAMVRLFCYDDGDDATRKWGIWGNSGLPASIGTKGFFIFLAQISGSEVIQMFKSDVVTLGGSGLGLKPLQAYQIGNTIRVLPGTIGNRVPTINDLPLSDPLASFAIAPGFYQMYAACPASNLGSVSFPSGTPSVHLSATIPSDTDTMGHIAIAGITVYGEQAPYLVYITNYLSGSLWGERLKVTGGTAIYYFNSI